MMSDAATSPTDDRIHARSLGALPAPTRLATMTQFSEWVRALPDHKSLPAVDGFFRFLSERFPCK
jgi:hypothetical protein